MPLIKLLAALAFLAALGARGAASQPALGAQGAERAPHRLQAWLVPSVDPAVPSHALLFRPQGQGPFPLALIAHASTQNALRRAQMPQPDYRALAAFLVARGFAVLVPERLGHGATGGQYREDQGGCETPDYTHAGRATADQIAVAMDYLRKQSFIRPDRAVIIGHSAGGWGALAVAGEKLDGVAAIIVFAPGRGGRANDAPDEVCAPHRLIAAATDFGRAARVPVTWLVAANDSYFPPALSRQLADAFRASGGQVDFHVLPPDGREGHWLPEIEEGVRLASQELDRALRRARPASAKSR